MNTMACHIAGIPTPVYELSLRKLSFPKGSIYDVHEVKTSRACSF
jgi:hypothetical protein